jgi:hypothetical protein
MIFTPKQLDLAAMSFETRFRLAYLSVDFNPTIVVACTSQLLIANVYRGMVVKRHFLGPPRRVLMRWSWYLRPGLTLLQLPTIYLIRVCQVLSARHG